MALHFSGTNRRRGPASAGESQLLSGKLFETYSNSDTSDFLRHCFRSTEWHALALQHPARYWRCRIASRAFFVQARRNLGNTLERVVTRRLRGTRFTAKYDCRWSLRHCRNVELFRTNAPDVGRNSRLQESQRSTTAGCCFPLAEIHLDAPPEP